MGCAALARSVFSSQRRRRDGGRLGLGLAWAARAAAKNLRRILILLGVYRDQPVAAKFYAGNGKTGPGGRKNGPLHIIPGKRTVGFGHWWPPFRKQARE